MAKLVWTEEALRWLEDIFEYIAQDNPEAAARTVQGIYERAQALVDHQEMGSGTRARSVTSESSSTNTTELRTS